MTGKDFEVIAKALRDHRPLFPHSLDDESVLWNLLVARFAIVCGDSNPRFSKQKFLHACYQDVGPKIGVDNTTPVR